METNVEATMLSPGKQGCSSLCTECRQVKRKDSDQQEPPSGNTGT